MPPPNITEEPVHMTVPGGITAIFKCVGQGYGLVDVSWLRSGNDLRTKSNVTTTVSSHIITSILTIPEVNNRDERNYRCIYNNSGGQTRSRIGRLTIGSKCMHIVIVLLLCIM